MRSKEKRYIYYDQKKRRNRGQKEEFEISRKRTTVHQLNISTSKNKGESSLFYSEKKYERKIIFYDFKEMNQDRFIYIRDYHYIYTLLFI